MGDWPPSSPIRANPRPDLPHSRSFASLAVPLVSRFLFPPCLIWVKLPVVLQRLRSHWRDWLPVLLAAGTALLPVWESALPGRVLLPLDIVTQSWPPWQQPNLPVHVHNPLLSDVVAYIYPMRTLAAEAVRSGEWPLWNPYALGGYPFTYNTQAGLYYPLSLLYYALPFPTAVDWTIALQLLIGAWGMAAYLRLLGLRPPAVLVGALLFVANGMMAVWLEWQVVHAAVIWLPLQLLYGEKLLRRPTPGAAAALAIAFALPWLNGHWNWTLYISLTGGAYLLAQAVALRRTLDARFWRWAAVGLALGVALTAVQVLPAVLYLAQSHRGPFTWPEAQARGLLRSGMLLFAPDFFGSPLRNDWWGVETLNFNEATAYIGVGPLLLVLWAALNRNGRATAVQRRVGRFFAGWGALGLLWMLGTPAYRLLHALPVFNGLFPSRAAVVWIVSLAVLAALAVERLTADPPPARAANRLFFAGGVLLAVLGGYLWLDWAGVAARREVLTRSLLPAVVLLALNGAVVGLRLRGALRGATAGWLFGLLLAADLTGFAWGYNTVGRTADLYPPTATAAFLQSQTAPLRIVSPAQGEAYQPNAAQIDRIENISGYEPGILTWVVEYLTLAEGESPIRFDRKLLPLRAVASPLLDALNVAYVVTIGDRFADQQVVEVAAGPVAGWGDLPIAQPLTVSAGGLQRIDVPLTADPTAPPDSPLRLSIWSADETYEFAHAVLAPDALQDGLGRFVVAPFPAEWGRHFIVRIEGAAQIGLTAEGAPAWTVYRLAQPDLAFADGKTRVYANAGALPRVWLVGEVRQAAVPEEVPALLAQLAQEPDGLARAVVIAAAGPLPNAVPPAAGASAVYERLGLNRIRIRVRTDRPTWLVVADTWYPGWQATVDGRPTPVWQANLMLRAVHIPAADGEQLIEMRFRPWDVQVGAAISGTAAVGVAALALVDWRRRRAAQEAA